MSMITDPPEWLKKFQENILLLDFIIEKSQNMGQPMTLNMLCKNYKDSLGGLTPVNTIKKRFEPIIPRIHELADMSNDTKVRVLFAIGASVNEQFFNELAQDAHVVVDEHRQIILYIKNDGSLQLKRAQVPLYPVSPTAQKKSNPETLKEIEMVLKFLAEETKTTLTPTPTTVLIRKFRLLTGFSKGQGSASTRFNQAKSQIFTASKYDMNVRIQMLFISKAPLAGTVLEELRKGASVEVDAEGRITNYKAFDGSLELPTAASVRAQGNGLDLTNFVARNSPEVTDTVMTIARGRRLRQRMFSPVVQVPKKTYKQSTSTRPVVPKRKSIRKRPTASKATVGRKNQGMHGAPTVRRSFMSNNVEMEEPRELEEVEEEMMIANDEQFFEMNDAGFDRTPPVDYYQEEFQYPANSTAIFHDPQTSPRDFPNFSPIPGVYRDLIRESSPAPSIVQSVPIVIEQDNGVQRQNPEEEEEREELKLGIIYYSADGEPIQQSAGTVAPITASQAPSVHNTVSQVSSVPQVADTVSIQSTRSITESNVSYRSSTIKMEEPDEVRCDTLFVPIHNNNNNNNNSNVSIPFPLTSSLVPETPIIDCKIYLRTFRSLVYMTKSPLMSDMRKEVDAAFATYQKKTHRVSINKLLCTFHTMLMIAIQYSKPFDPVSGYSKDAYMSLRNFLDSLYGHVIALHCTELEAEIDRARDKLVVMDKIVPIERIRDSLATVLYIATSEDCRP